MFLPMRAFLALSLLSIATFCTGTGALAGGGSICDGDWCAPCPPVGATEGVLLITPAGTGPTLEEWGLTLTVQLADCDFAGWLAGYPASQIQLEATDTGAVFCGPVVADHDTDAEGRTTFSGALAGGGWYRYEAGVYPRIRVTVGGSSLLDPIPLSLVSPDLNGDLRVDLADVGIYALDFANGIYDFRSDLYPDGVENLADIGVFAQHMGERCP